MTTLKHKTEDTESNNIEMHLTEYRALREEQKTRLTMNGTMMNYIFIIIGAVIASYVQMTIAGKGDYFPIIILATPLLTTPITLFYYDNTLMVYRVARYFSTELYPLMEKQTGVTSFGWERFHQATSGQLALVALGRNLFFVLVTIGPVAIFLILRVGYNDLFALSLFHPVIAWDFISKKLGRWELWLLTIDLTLLTLVLVTWAHSGFYFLGVTPISFIKDIYKRIKASIQKKTKAS